MTDPHSDDPATLHEEAQLLDYLLGHASSDLRQAIEGAPQRSAAAQQLAKEVLPLLQLTYRSTCLEAETLVSYQLRMLSGTDELVARQHLLDCPLCQEEYQLLVELNAETEPQQSLGRRLVEALFRPPLQLQVLGSDLLHYQALDTVILLNSTASHEQPQRWTLWGEVSHVDGQPPSEPIEAITLWRLDEPDPQPHTANSDPDGAFVFRNLLAGPYTLSLLTSQAELVIRTFTIGEGK